MSSASYCDRCGKAFYVSVTLRGQVHPAAVGHRATEVETTRGVHITDLFGSGVFELCEACSVELRDWIEAA